MAGTDSVREVLAHASEQLRQAGQAANHLRADRYLGAGEYARGVLDAVGASMADDDVADECVVAGPPASRSRPTASQARPRDVGSGRFLPKSDGQAARERTPEQA